MEKNVEVVSVCLTNVFGWSLVLWVIIVQCIWRQIHFDLLWECARIIIFVYTCICIVQNGNRLIVEVYIVTFNGCELSDWHYIRMANQYCPCVAILEIILLSIWWWICCQVQTIDAITSGELSSVCLSENLWQRLGNCRLLGESVGDLL